jgi:hypothetical protein
MSKKLQKVDLSDEEASELSCNSDDSLVSHSSDKSDSSDN